MAGFIFGGINSPTITIAEQKQMLIDVLWYQNYWILATCIPYIILVRDKPEFPPSLVSMEESKEANFCAEIGNALRLPNYIKLMVTYLLLQGGFLSFGINMS